MNSYKLIKILNKSDEMWNAKPKSRLRIVEFNFFIFMLKLVITVKKIN